MSEALSTFYFVWFGAGVALAPFTYAMTFAYFQGLWPSLASRHVELDRRCGIFQAALGILTGPVVPVIIFFLSDRAKHGLKWKAK